MPISRRKLLVAGTIAPFLTSCATDLARFSKEPFPGLANRLGVCAASYVTLNAGRPNAPVVVSSCPTSHSLNSDTVFQAASLTKQVIAFVALKLVLDGRLDLRAPVSHYLPGGYTHHQNPFSGTNDSQIDLVPASTLTRIPVGTLLNHSSGLPNWTSSTLSPEFEPGERWQYSGEGYLLLQTVISAITEQDIESFTTEYVFEPLDMRHSRLRLTEDIRDKVVEGTSRFGWSNQFDFVVPNASASLYTTAKDYSNLLSAWFSDPTLLSLTISNPIPAEPDLGLEWGYGWGIEAATGGPYLWQWGNNPGFRAFAMVSVSTGNGFVLLTNSERGMPLATVLARSTVPARHGVFQFALLD
jgi:CubicO group peptidase (beta-lactamase class C family)